MIIHSKSPVGEKALEEKTAALIGLSIRNSYFKEENLEEIITWAKENFSQVFLMLPDVPAISTLRSLGYPENKARQRAMLACNNLENKCGRIIDELGISDQTKIIRWKDLEGNVHYEKTLKDLNNLYQSDTHFREDVRETTKGVITNNETTLSLDEALDIGVNFILQELACILDSAKIFEVPSCAYIYHQEMPVHVKILKSEYPYTPPPNTGYVIAEVEPK